MLRVLSLGAGVQSSTVLLMSIRGDLPKIDAAIFADTGWEPKVVYKHLAWLETQAEEAGIPIHRVTAGNIRDDAVRSRMRAEDYNKVKDGRWAAMPLYTLADGSTERGQIKRQCTSEYKIEPIERCLRRQILGLKPGQKAPANSIEHWFGISRDEMRRVRQPKGAWSTYRYPLIFDIPMTRRECLEWNAANGYPRPPRSACIGCPFKSDNEWRQLRENPEEWADAVELDGLIREGGGMRGKTYLHSQCVPLDEVDLSTAEERGQMNWLNECEGYCGN